MLPQKPKGTTLVEILIVVSISIILLAGVGMGYGKVFSETHPREDYENLLETINLARERSLSGLNNQNHGIYFATDENKYYIYQGTNYATSQNDFTVEYSFLPQTDIEVSLSDNDLNFQKFTGSPNQTGSINLGGGDTDYIITINSLGIIVK